MEKRAREQEAVGDERVENSHLSSFSTDDDDDDDSHHCSYCGCHCDCDCEGESPSSIIKLDDNGFPPSQLSSGLQDYEGSLPTSIELHTYRSFPSGETAAATASSFASDFYGCGTDWSSLLLPENDNHNNNKDDPKATPRRLKQTNLFQMWGVNIKVPDPNTSEANHDGPSSSSSLHHHHHPIKKPMALFSAGSSSNPRLNSNSTTTTTNNNNNNNAFLHLLRSNASTGAKSKRTGGITSGRATLTNNTGGVANKQRPRVCPFYKKIPGTPFTVDAFCYGRIEGCNAYILSHFHADHYGGLSKGWSHGPIYCTPLTARLVRLCLYVNPIFIHSLELGTEYIIEGIKVTMLEANHCPGAALIHFCLPNGQCYLHTGDFRASELMHTYSLLVKQQVNVLYLDTTYCNPKYRFPSKEDVLSFVVKVTRNFLNKHPKTLIIVGAYSIGKECVYLAISKALGVKIHANSSRRRILQSFGWPELSGNLCPNGNETPLHVLPISSLRFEVLDHYSKTYRNQYTAVLAFRPTGWTYSEAIGSYLDLIKPSSRGIVTIYGVPYSEHSNFTELREFVQFIRPDKIIPTVNVGNAANRDKMQSYFREWLKG